MSNTNALVPYDYSAVGLSLPEDLTFEQWEEIGRTLFQIEKSWQWWVGDWLKFGEFKWGEKYASAIEVTDKEYQTLANVLYVAKTFSDFSRRREKLTWTHHAEVAGIKDKKRQDKLLDNAEKHGWSCAELRRQAKTVHVSHNTGFEEWYTPTDYVEAARETLGQIDLDPATSEAAQKNVQAGEFYTVDDDGLSKEWRGKVYMNPPYTSGVVDKFMEKLCDHFCRGEVTEAVTLTNNATDTQWFHDTARFASALCFPRGRIKFVDTEGNPSGAPLQGQAFMYLGDNVDGFIEKFGKFGLVCRTDK